MEPTQDMLDTRCDGAMVALLALKNKANKAPNA